MAEARAALDAFERLHAARDADAAAAAAALPRRPTEPGPAPGGSVLTERESRGARAARRTA